MSWKVADLEPPLAGVFADGGVATSLGTAVSVKVHIRRPDGTLLSGRGVNLPNQSTTPGGWSMPWQSLDLNQIGTYRVELEIEWTSGRKQTTPTVGFYVGEQIA